MSGWRIEDGGWRESVETDFTRQSARAALRLQVGSRTNLKQETGRYIVA